MNDEHWMQQALMLAKRAEAAGEVPVGAVVVAGDELIAEGFNQPIGQHDASAHAEVMALRAAGETLQNYRLPGATVYVTLEPCSMCVGAMIHARVSHVVFGASDPRTGALGGAYDLQHAIAHNHHFEVTSGVMEQDCREMLQAFFRARRKGC